MYLAHYDNTGKVWGFYIEGMHTHIPAPTMEITPEQHAEFFERGQNHCVIDGVWTYVEPAEPSLSSLKQSKLQQIDAWTAEAIAGGFVSAAVGVPHRYDSEAVDQKNLIMMLQAVQTDGFADHPLYQGQIPVRAVPQGESDKVVLQHSGEQMQLLVADLAAHTGYCKQVGWQLQLAVEEAQTAEELTGIIWPEQTVQTHLDPVTKSWWRRLF